MVKYLKKGGADMDDSVFFSTLSEVFAENGLSSLLNKDKAQKFLLLTKHMLEENEKYNLTAITDPAEIIVSHYADCAMLCAYLPKGAKIADVGCGAGFPTLPIAILREDVSVLAMDSTGKRVDYVAGCAEMLGLSNVRTLCIRAEDAGRDKTLRESFPFVCARAVANLRVLCELCLPLLAPGGKMLAMKGKNAEYELRDAKRAISLLGAVAKEPAQISLKGAKETASHPLVILEKKSKTPPAYPRAYAQIAKKPL